MLNNDVTKEYLKKSKELYVYDNMTGEVLFVMQEDGTVHQSANLNIALNYGDSYTPMVKVNGRMFLTNFRIDDRDIISK